MVIPPASKDQFAVGDRNCMPEPGFEDDPIFVVGQFGRWPTVAVFSVPDVILHFSSVDVDTPDELYVIIEVRESEVWPAWEYSVLVDQCPW